MSFLREVSLFLGVCKKVGHCVGNAHVYGDLPLLYGDSPSGARGFPYHASHIRNVQLTAWTLLNPTSVCLVPLWSSLHLVPSSPLRLPKLWSVQLNLKWELTCYIHNIIFQIYSLLFEPRWNAMDKKGASTLRSLGSATERIKSTSAHKLSPTVLMEMTGGRGMAERWSSITMVMLKQAGQAGIAGEILGDACEWLLRNVVGRSDKDMSCREGNTDK